MVLLIWFLGFGDFVDGVLGCHGESLDCQKARNSITYECFQK